MGQRSDVSQPMHPQAILVARTRHSTTPGVSHPNRTAGQFFGDLAVRHCGMCLALAPLCQDSPVECRVVRAANGPPGGSRVPHAVLSHLSRMDIRGVNLTPRDENGVQGSCIPQTGTDRLSQERHGPHFGHWACCYLSTCASSHGILPRLKEIFRCRPLQPWYRLAI